jgi:hypothetical protein
MKIKKRIIFLKSYSSEKQLSAPTNPLKKNFGKNLHNYIQQQINNSKKEEFHWDELAAELIIYKNYKSIFLIGPNFTLNYNRIKSQFTEANTVIGGPDKKIKNFIKLAKNNARIKLNTSNIFEKTLKLVYKNYYNQSILDDPIITNKIISITNNF